MIAAAAIVLAFSAALVLIRVLRGPTVWDRILALNSLGTKTVLIVALVGFFGVGEGLYIDTSLVYALINFVATIAILKYIEHRRIS